MENSVVAIIPARGGSKGIPRKNVRPLAGKPLIGWTIEAALGAKCLNGIFVSTEDDEIAATALSYGVAVLPRPAALAQDDVQLDEVVLYSLRQLRLENGIQPKTIVLLPPTSPLRAARHIDEAFDLYTGNTVIAACPDPKFHWRFSSGAMRRAESVFHDPMHRKGRQWVADNEKLYWENGSLYITSAEAIILEKTFRAPPYVLYVMSPRTSQEIDEPDDWELAERLLSRGGDTLGIP